MMNKEKYFLRRPLYETYKKYEIRTYKKFFIVDAAIGIYGIMANTIEDCYSFIDELTNKGISQYDNEAVSKYIFYK